jgi:hypothetical protein
VGKVEGSLQVMQNACIGQMVGSRWSRPKSDHKEASMEKLYYIGLDIHKKVIAYCIKTKKGHLV